MNEPLCQCLCGCGEVLPTNALPGLSAPAKQTHCLGCQAAINYGDEEHG